MHATFSNALALIAGASLLFGCGSDSGSRGSSGERASYLMVSSTLGYAEKSRSGLGAQQAALTDLSAVRPCTVAGSAGSCLTPTAARGKVVNLSLGGSSGPPVRLFGTGEGLDRDARIELAAFDLQAPAALPGEGTLQEAPAGTTFTRLDTTFGYVEVQLALEQKFWTVRFLFYPQPIERDPAVKMCVDQHRLDAIATNGAVIADSPAFARGDVMYCEKSSAAETCLPSEFKWLDGTTLAAARPTAPRQVRSIAESGITCTLHPEGPTEANHFQPGELNFRGFRMSSQLTTPLPLWAELVGCNKTFHARTAGGALDSGTSLEVVLNYDLSDFVFFPGITDPAAASVETLLGVVTLAPLHARELLGEGPAAAEFSRVTATPTLGHEPVGPCDGATTGAQP